MFLLIFIHLKMKQYLITISVLLLNFVLFGQTIEDLKRKNNSEIKELKKDYFEHLQRDQDARIFSIIKQRDLKTLHKLEYNRYHNHRNNKKDSVTRHLASIKKQQELNKQAIKYNDSITNALGYRRVNKIITKREKKRQLEELRASNKRELFYRSQAKNQHQELKKADLKEKINDRHDVLKEKYTIEKSD